jgi:hypothetical protein
MTTRVWETTAEMNIIEEWSRTRRLVSLRSRDDKPYARLLSTTQPTPEAVDVEATLEDAYLDLLAAAPAASRMTA